jgi:hypothetical protein
MRVTATGTAVSRCRANTTGVNGRSRETMIRTSGNDETAIYLN